MRDLIRYTHRPSKLYILVQGDGNWLDRPDVPTFVASTGYLVKQLVAELMALIAFELGSRNGRFHGSVLSASLSLCEQDWWAECETPGIRTWRRERDSFRYFPYTLSDIRTVTRCGDPFVETDSGTTIIMSRGCDGLTVSPISPGAVETVLTLVRSFGIPAIADDDTLSDYIDIDGFFTF